MFASDSDFGRQLRRFRLQTADPNTGKPLSQQKFGELLGSELGTRSAYTGAAISDWELAKSRISADNRFLLINLVKILKRYGGIKTPADADRLLESGNFRALNPTEKGELFPGETDEIDPPSQNPSNLQFLAEAMNLALPAAYRSMLEESKKGPPPFWPRLAVSLTRKFTEGLTASRALKGIVWLWIAYLAVLLIAPSLNPDFPHYDSPLSVMISYAAGSLLLPVFIGGMTNTRDNPYWAEQKIQNAPILRSYVYQGAFVGFHVGYFLAYLVTAAQVISGVGAVAWVELMKIIPPLLLGYAGAQLVPYNLWLAYGRLQLKDGGVFFVFAVLGPLWALFYLEFYETLLSPVAGGVVLLSALTIVAAIEAAKQKRKGASTKK